MDKEIDLLRDKIENLALMLDCPVYELLNVLEGQLITEEEAGEIRAIYESN